RRVLFRSPPPDRRAKHPKLDSHLVAVASAADTAGVAAGIQVARERRLAISANRVRVVLRTSGDRSPVRKVVVALGGVVDAEYAELVQAFVPTTVLRRLADDPVVLYVGVPLTPIALAVTDEGVGTTNAGSWQTAGWSGAGVKVGVVDFGFIGYTTKQASGDLPGS